MHITRRLGIALIALAASSSSWGHGIWFAQRAGHLALVYGEGAEDLDAVKCLSKITSVGGANVHGERVPVRLEPEGKLAFVNFDGRPVAGAKVWQDIVTDPDSVPLVSDADGKVTLPVRNQGLNVVKTEHETASVDPGKTDMMHHLATLSFMLKHAPE